MAADRHFVTFQASEIKEKAKKCRPLQALGGVLRARLLAVAWREEVPSRGFKGGGPAGLAGFIRTDGAGDSLASGRERLVIDAKKRRPFLSSLVVWASCAPASAATLTVDLNGGADYTDIQSAIDAAADGDTVLVKPGEYVITEPIDFNRLHDWQNPDAVRRSRRAGQEGDRRRTGAASGALSSVEREKRADRDRSPAARSALRREARSSHGSPAGDPRARLKGLQGLGHPLKAVHFQQLNLRASA